MWSESYTRFLPSPWRGIAESVEPQSWWWPWRTASGDEITVHLAGVRDRSAPLRVMLLHGAGGHSGLVWPLAAVLASEGYEVLAPDLPLYGRTRVGRRGRVEYRDWVDLVSDLIDAETADDQRPLVLFGASVGGMLAYEAGSHNAAVTGVVATCLLDIAGDPNAARAAARWPILARLAPLAPRLPRALRGVPVPISWLAPLRSMSANPELNRLCARDRLGGGGTLTLGFVADLFTHRVPDPSSYRGAPVMLVHPAADAWTPPELSIGFAERIAASTEIHLLTGCGHFPIEQPGLDELAGHLRALAASAAPDAGPDQVGELGDTVPDH